MLSILQAFININLILMAILDTGIVNTTTLYMRKQRQGEVKKIAQGYTDSKYQIRDSGPHVYSFNHFAIILKVHSQIHENVAFTC